MIIYKRHIKRKLLGLRLSFFILGTVCFLAFRYKYENLGYFIAVVLITLSIIVVKDLIVCSDSFEISKYYFFGLIIKTWQFNKDENINRSSFGSEFGEDGELPDFDDMDSGVGCLFLIFSIFVPFKIAKKEFKIDKFDELNNRLKHVHVLLDNPEFNYLQAFIADRKEHTKAFLQGLQTE